ncbi:class I SAM-dependent methyltransferase [Flexivirga alba]|uniref:Class I SAM-dependent methyltransferase n=1 Tax=Flexivirga alba TaxID=702742 RepID=A0ABW2AGS2_9MICO
MPQPSAHRADTFLLPGVAEAYRARPPYPPEVIDRLIDLAGGGRVLDLGAGEGSIARRLVGRVSSVVAVERSAPMIEVGRALPGGTDVTWHCEAAETFTAPGPFDLAVVGEAMHWFDLPAVMIRLHDVLREGRPLALVDRSVRHARMPEVVEVIKRFSRAIDYDPTYDVADDLTDRGLWVRVGEVVPTVTLVRQSSQAYLESLHSTSSLARALMTPEENAAFDAAVLETLRPITDSDGMLTLDVTARLVWGSVRSQSVENA